VHSNERLLVINVIIVNVIVIWLVVRVIVTECFVLFSLNDG